MGLAERVARIGHACGVSVTRVDPLELQVDAARERSQSAGARVIRHVHRGALARLAAARGVRRGDG